MTKTKRNIINGVDIDETKAMIEMVKNDPSQGMTKWKVSSRWLGQTRSRSEVESFSIGGKEVKRKHAFEIDEPIELGGTDQKPNPQEYLLGALNACMMVGYIDTCAMMGIQVESLEIETRGEIDLRGFMGLDQTIKPGYDSLELDVRIKADASEEQLKEVHEVVKKTSPNFFNISQPVKLKPNLIVE